MQTVDSPDSGQNACDNYHVRVLLTQNPSNVYKFDVISDHCQGAAACPTSVTDFQFFTNFSDANWADGIDEQATGECPCREVDTEGFTLCSDNSATYLVRLFREPGAPLTCDPYEIEFSNGVYPPN